MWIEFYGGFDIEVKADFELLIRTIDSSIFKVDQNPDLKVSWWNTRLAIKIESCECVYRSILANPTALTMAIQNKTLINPQSISAQVEVKNRLIHPSTTPTTQIHLIQPTIIEAMPVYRLDWSTSQH